MSEVAKLSLRAGRVRVDAKVAMTPAGLAATGFLVGTILLSTSVLVGVAVQGGRMREGPPLPRSDGPSSLDTRREED